MFIHPTAVWFRIGHRDWFNEFHPVRWLDRMLELFIKQLTKLNFLADRQRCNLIEQRLSSHLRHNYTSLQSSRPGEDRECFRTVMSIHTVLSGRTGKEPPVKETTWIINSQSGELTVEGLQQSELIQLAADLLPSGKSVNCARPINIQPLRNSSPRVSDGEPFLRVFRIYHDSVV